MADDGWRISTEGDLDPDLTEEAGYGGWEAPRRSGWRFVYRLGLALTLFVVIGVAVLVFVH